MLTSCAMPIYSVPMTDSDISTCVSTLPAAAAPTVSASCGTPENRYVTPSAALLSAAAVAACRRPCAAQIGSSSAAAKQEMLATVYAVLCSKCSARLKRPVLARAESTGLLDEPAVNAKMRKVSDC